MSKTEVQTGIVKQGSAKFGKSLVTAAAESNRDTLQKTVVNKVSEILMQLQKQRDYIAQSEKNVELLQAKVAALEAGQFELSNYGVITFHDEKLQKGALEMLECLNCGYRLHGRQVRLNGAITESY